GEVRALRAGRAHSRQVALEGLERRQDRKVRPIDHAPAIGTVRSLLAAQVGRNAQGLFGDGRGAVVRGLRSSRGGGRGGGERSRKEGDGGSHGDSFRRVKSIRKARRLLQESLTHESAGERSPGWQKPESAAAQVRWGGSCAGCRRKQPRAETSRGSPGPGRHGRPAPGGGRGRPEAARARR